MRKCFRSCIAALIAVIVLLPACAQDASQSVQYRLAWVGPMPIHVITADLRDTSLQVTVGIANDHPGSRRSFVSFLAKHQPLAQITGSYFSMRSGYPIGDIVVDGQWHYNGDVGSALVVRPDNTARIINLPKYWNGKWDGYETVLQGGVRLLQDGKFAVYPKDQGFRDGGLFRPAARTAVGLTPAGKLVFAAISKPVYLSKLAALLKQVGCRDAMSCDGGTSTGMAFGSSVILTPGRTISNVLMVVRRPEPAAPSGEVPPYPVNGDASDDSPPATEL
ncbi:MAG: phosphodiester glycosidase family protein [Armatimonadota bacterium]